VKRWGKEKEEIGKRWGKKVKSEKWKYKTLTT